MNKLHSLTFVAMTIAVASCMIPTDGGLAIKRTLISRFDLTPVQPETLRALGRTTQFQAKPWSADGTPLSDVPFYWSTSDTRIATIDPSGLARVVGPGTAIVTVRASGPYDGVTFSSVRLPVRQIVTALALGSRSILKGIPKRLSMTAKDSAGQPITSLPGRVWQSRDSNVAVVDSLGSILGVSVGSTTISATIDGISASAQVTVRILRFSSVVAGAAHTCGYQPDGAVYCWGDNGRYQLGDGTSISRAYPDSLAVTLVSLSAGAQHTCGITAGGRAYCWGDNLYGQLGVGNTATATIPTQVTTPQVFRAVSAGGQRTCALNVAGLVYCWGADPRRETAPDSLECIPGGGFGGGFGGGWGGGSGGFKTAAMTPCQRGPRLFDSTLTLVSLRVGANHACGLTTDGSAWCWGDNASGQLGATTTQNCSDRAPPYPCSTKAVMVQGGIKFRDLSVGASHTCGLAGDVTYCWGANSAGQLGDGTTTNRGQPTPISGGPALASITGGDQHTCGVTADGAAYCWGSNSKGQAGNQPLSFYIDRPGAAAAGFAFRTLAAGAEHTCGISRTSGITYCWGANVSGQLGATAGPNAYWTPQMPAGQE